jgi:hypothetical protein
MFTMSGGEISGNSVATASSSGGGVYVGSNSSFVMSGGKISSNSVATASSFGGGVYVGYDGGTSPIGGTFTMNGGEISGNTAFYGGGVYIFLSGTDSLSGTFTKQSGGVIYGTDASDTQKNTAGVGSGHAVSVSYDQKKRNTTAGAGVTLDSTKTGTAGGWE